MSIKSVGTCAIIGFGFGLLIGRDYYNYKIKINLTRELNELKEEIKHNDSIIKYKHKIIGNELPKIVDKYYKCGCDDI